METNLRIFSPVILFHENNSANDYDMIQLQKEKVNAMLKTNLVFWEHIIHTTRQRDNSLSPATCYSSLSSKEEEEEDDDDDDDDDNGEKEEEKEKQCKRRLVQKKRRGNLPKCVTAILKQWLIDHHKHPYPTEEEKRALGLKTDLTLNQISNWFINARRRILPFILSQKK